MIKRIIFIFLLAGLLSPLAVAQQDADTTAKSLVLHSPRKAALYSAVIPGMGQAYNKKYWKIPIVYAGFGAMGYFIHFNSSHFTQYKQSLIDFNDDDPSSNSYLDLLGSGIDPGYFDPSLGSPNYSSSNEDWFRKQLESGMDYYKRYRDLSVILTFAWYALNIIDATVDGYLYTYDMSEDLSFYIDHQFYSVPAGVKYMPAPLTGMGIKLGLSF